MIEVRNIINVFIIETIAFLKLYLTIKNISLYRLIMNNLEIPSIKIFKFFTLI